MRVRSVLFTPGDRPGMLDKARSSSADVVVFDLEDGVAREAKDRARSAVAESVDGLAAGGSPPTLVRINPVAHGGRADLDALAAVDTGGLAGLVVPKVDGPAEVRHVGGLLRDRGLPRRLWCLLETPAAVLAADRIAAVDDVEAVVFGGEDYAAAVGADRTPEGTELLAAKQRVVMAAAAGDVAAIDGITSAIEDLERVRADARRARTFGFDGKLAIHPSQLDPINEAFAPDEDQLAWARRVVELAGEADGGAVRVDDEMVDAPLLERARQILEAAGEVD